MSKLTRYLTWLAACWLLLYPASASAQVKYETVTFTNTAVGLTASTLVAANGEALTACVGKLETAQIRIRYDGTAPTTTEGTLVDVGEIVQLTSNAALQAFRGIRTGGTSGIIRFHCTVGTTLTLVPPGASLSLTGGDASAANQVTGNASLAAIDSSASRLISSASTMAPGAPLATTAFVAGGVYNATPPTFTTTQQGAIQLSSAGRVLVELPTGGSGLTNTELRASAVPISVASVPTHAVTGSGSFTVDSELPTAAAITDNFANPTTTSVMAMSMCWDGATWDRCTGSAADTELSTAAAAADAFANPTAGGVLGFNMCWNGTTWDRCQKSLVSEVTEDVAETAAAVGNYAMTVRRDTAASSAGTTGDNATLNTDANGRLWATTTITDGTDTLLIDGSGNLAVSCSNCTGSGVSAIDNSAFVGGTNTVASMGAVYDTTPPTITDGSVGAPRMDSTRYLYTVFPSAQAVTVSSGTVTTVSTVTNLSQLGGTAISMNTGVRDAGTQRVTIATNDVVPASQSGTWNVTNVSGTVSLPTGASTLAEQQTQTTSLGLLDDSQTGDSVHYRTSAGTTEDEHEIKATAGRLFSVAFTNTNAAVRYWRCYNLTAANTTPGTSTVFLGLAIPGAATGAGFVHSFGPNGVAFSTALTCSFVTGAADTDVAEVAANEIKAVYGYK